MNTTTQHTPGPWKVIPDTVKVTSRRIVRHDEHGQNFLAKVYARGQYGHHNLAECEANARLIAAAPEMLTALRMLVEDATERGDDPAGLTLARALLARIDGAQEETAP